jgi:hypothetical protein
MSGYWIYEDMTEHTAVLHRAERPDRGPLRSVACSGIPTDNGTADAAYRSGNRPDAPPVTALALPGG